MFPYAEESFTPEETEILRRYVTNLDGPVFALVNLPEVVKGALFARYSRSPKSLRRLFLDEFAGDLDLSGDQDIDATAGVKRAEQLYDRVFLEYGDDSVAQLGGVHLACEQASNLLTKIIERGRLMAYLEQSTRYIGYDARLATGHYRYYRDPAILDSALGARYVGEMDRMFDTYAELLAALQAWLPRRFGLTTGEHDLAFRRALKAKALDALRGLLPAGALSNVGIYGTGQSYEMLLMRMRCHPLPEARQYAELMLTELRKVIPSFLQRVDREDRGTAWSAYMEATRRDTAEMVEKLWPGETGRDAALATEVTAEPLVRLVDWDPDGEDKVIAAMCYEASGSSDEELLRRVRSLGTEERMSIVRAYVGTRANRRQRPGRAFERTAYRFEMVSDYGAFRDLQRHRMLTIEWQALSPELGYEVPGLIEEAGMAKEFAACLRRSADLYEALVPAFVEQASYAVALAYRIRYVMQLDAREALHVIELRSGVQGHPSYRRIAHEMHRLIGEGAGHRLIASAMSFVDYEEYDLERLQSERRAQERREAATRRNDGLMDRSVVP
ncbi:MAG: FAD-dependent thymidylate synthase [Acidimicrobiales bacterium]